MIFGETIITAPFAVCFLYRKDQHALVTQKRLKLSPTLFIATLESDLEMISLCNLTGEIILEKFGSKEKRVLAPNLIHFIQELTPVVEPLE